MVLQNRRDESSGRSHEESGELSPCQKPVDARKTKTALKVFIAACGAAAAAATVAVVVSGANPAADGTGATSGRTVWSESRVGHVIEHVGYKLRRVLGLEPVYALPGQRPAGEITADLTDDVEDVEEGEENSTTDTAAE